MEDRQARELVVVVESSLERLDAVPEAERELAQEAIAGICELYGEALRRLLHEGQRRDDASWLVRFARTDEVVSHLLLLHGLHPDGEEPLEKLYAAEAPAAAMETAAPRRLEPELVPLGSRRRAAAGSPP
jgi:hypothetical protein